MSLSKSEIKKALAVAVKAAQLGEKVLLRYFGSLKNVSEKHRAGLVSEADLESERVISRYLRKQYPEIPILGEEDAYQKQVKSPGTFLKTFKDQRTMWLVDPLDGTTNYVHKLPFYCVSIGLMWDQKLVAGVCNLPSMGVVYTAGRGLGAFKNGQRLKVSQRRTLESALLATGFSNENVTKSQIQIFGRLVHRVRGIRRVGSAAYDLCLVAEGAYDGYWEQNLSPWDTAAGALIVEEAGGKVSDFYSNSFSPFDKTVVAASTRIFKPLKEQIVLGS